MGGALLGVLAYQTIMPQVRPPDQSGEFYLSIFGDYIIGTDTEADQDPQHRLPHLKNRTDPAERSSKALAADDDDYSLRFCDGCNASDLLRVDHKNQQEIWLA